MDITRHPALVDSLAAGYALGTLHGGARRRFEAIARQSPSVRARVLVWQEHFAAMAELQPQLQPGPRVWDRIAAAIRSEPAPAATASRVPDPSLLQRLSRGVAWWRAATAAAAIAAVAAIAVAVQLNARPEIQYVAVLQDNAQAASVLVTFDPRRQTLTLKRVGGYREGPDRSLQLWALPPGQAPRSLGVLPGQPVARLAAGAREVATIPALAISLEPKGGAPTGSGPTGPVLFKGALLQTSL